ncbi:hypothetical protein DYB35_008367 [Aphanomyces astaci]|uniref:Uncharacterized protein n=1 Tax=Aphanomyces astaci TaxID=112090 RepID=A0A3R7A2N8_APHAT|nr:hypothetical protein DYB35_008367 [Aphanomyces astaci]
MGTLGLFVHDFPVCQPTSHQGQTITTFPGFGALSTFSDAKHTAAEDTSHDIYMFLITFQILMCMGSMAWLSNDEVITCLALSRTNQC